MATDGRQVVVDRIKAGYPRFRCSVKRLKSCGNATRARGLRAIQEEQRRRVAFLLYAVRSGKVEAPKSVQAAIRAVCRRQRSPETSWVIDRVLAALATSVRRGTREERTGAASCITHLAKVCTRPLTQDCPTLRYGDPDTLDSLKATLCDAKSDDLPEVQRALLKAFLVFRFGGDELFPVFVRLLVSGEGDVRKAAILAIRELGIDLAAGAVKEFADLLTDPIKSVRVAACEALQWLKADAVPAVPALVDFLHGTAESDLRVLAARALVAIDPKGRALSKIKSPVKRESLIEAFSRLGEPGRQLRRLLPPRWVKDDAAHPAEWMSVPEIAEKEKTGIPESTLRRRIADSTIRPHDERGTGKGHEYLVTEADLETWKQAHQSVPKNASVK